MAYTSGIFRIDLVSGSDTARTALTSCTASNPSGSITNIQKTGHGLVTGAIVDLTAFTAWLNSAWKITVVDANNFTLDAATWQTTGDTSGTVTPRGGSSWSDAWLTINNGATAERIQPGDEMRISKTADPVSLGQSATWTDGSQTVTLTSAVTKKVEDAISGWTAATNVTIGTNSNRKFGATAVQITPQTAFTTGKLAYKAIGGGGTQDFSAYQYINLWFRPNGATAFNASDFKICLCSDATGDTPVNNLNFPATLNSTGWNCLFLDNAGALGASIQSVAIYANVDPGTNGIHINNIFASNGDLSLKTLIGKTGDVNYNIQSIDGVTIKIDSNNTSATGRGYSGSTSTETLYYRVPFDVITTGTWGTINEAGDTLMPYNHYIGGYNTSNDTRDGVTVLGSKIVGVGSGLSASAAAYNKISYFTLARFSQCFNIATTNLYSCIACGSSTFSGNVLVDGIIDNCKVMNCASSSSFYGYNVIVKECELRNNSAYGTSVSSNLSFISCVFANNGSGALSVVNLGSSRGTGSVLLRNCIISDTIEVTNFASTNQYVWSFDHDNTPGNHWGFTTGATINMQTSIVHSTEPVAWKFTISGSTRTIYKPVTLILGPFTVAASALVTVTAWIKKDHATNVGAKLYVEDGIYNIEGVAADSATKADDTSWEELTITFTPTEAGVVPVFVDAWYAAGASNVYVGSITVTQA